MRLVHEILSQRDIMKAAAVGTLTLVGAPTIGNRAVNTYQVDLVELLNAFPQVEQAGSTAALPDCSPSSANFALFIRLPTGSSVGYGLAEKDLARAPIVLLGSEGEYRMVKGNLRWL
jgi:hypothetical protein